ncbi:hypothetical protein L6164_031282 [Bauhinia variegata]|uniref:Uncharacterized protein n=1 Tax=Bauhinia variegata TaxID=167791 RepID=A0ACB9LFU4_BAUVA|nr:hypothetical protein L6164_031282 [Bauhinia variegata]
MANQGCNISLSQLSPASSYESSDESSRSLATLSGSVIGGSSCSPKQEKSRPTAGYSLFGGANEHQIIPSSKKPRGRPPGSKNKPKPPLVITKEDEHALKPAIIDVPAGSDVVETIVRFALHRNVSVTVLSGTGVLSNVRLRHPVSPNRYLSYTGQYPMLSLYGSYINNSHSLHSPSNPSSSAAAVPLPPPSFGVCLLGPQGNCFGGIVCGEVIAATAIMVVVTTFKSPGVERVLIDENGEEGSRDVNTGVAAVSNNANAAEGGAGFGRNVMAVAAYNAETGGGVGTGPLNSQAAPLNLFQWGQATRNPRC